MMSFCRTVVNRRCAGSILMQQYSVLKLHILANCCLSNYTSRDIASFVRFPHLNSLSGHVKYTSNMAVWLPVASLNCMYCIHTPRSWANVNYSVFFNTDFRVTVFGCLTTYTKCRVYMSLQGETDMTHAPTHDSVISLAYTPFY